MGSVINVAEIGSHLHFWNKILNLSERNIKNMIGSNAIKYAILSNMQWNLSITTIQRDI